jgi:hypothetical protein
LALIFAALGPPAAILPGQRIDQPRIQALIKYPQRLPVGSLELRAEPNRPVNQASFETVLKNATDSLHFVPQGDWPLPFGQVGA